MIIYQVDILLDRGIALVLYSKLSSRLRVDTLALLSLLVVQLFQLAMPADIFLATCIKHMKAI